MSFFNFAQFWSIFGHFNSKHENYQNHKRKPRVVYCGSGAHFDVENRIKQKDDFYHVLDVIRKTVDKFQWVFVGGFPLSLRDLIQQKKIEYHEWSNLVEYPAAVSKLDATVFYAPLESSNFNKAFAAFDKTK